MASEVEICNRALQRLGAGSITSLSEASKAARECSLAYAPIRDRLLRAYVWNFSISRENLAADATAPIHGPARYFTLPSTCLRLLPPDQDRNFNDLDWQIEGRKIATNDSAPLAIRYVNQITDPNTMDSYFREVLSCDLAFDLCEAITQSNSKKESIRADRKTLISEAKLANSIENVPAESPEDEWVTARA